MDLRLRTPALRQALLAGAPWDGPAVHQCVYMPHQSISFAHPRIHPSYRNTIRGGSSGGGGWLAWTPDSLSEHAVDTLIFSHLPTPFVSYPIWGLEFGSLHTGNGPHTYHSPAPAPTSIPSTTTWQASRVLYRPSEGEEKFSAWREFPRCRDGSANLAPFLVHAVSFPAPRDASHLFFFFPRCGRRFLWATRNPSVFVRHRCISTHSPKPPQLRISSPRNLCPPPLQNQCPHSSCHHELAILPLSALTTFTFPRSSPHFAV